MDDYISRQAAIDYVDDVPYIKDHPNIALLWKAWVEQLPSAQPEPQWIPCSERLPERGIDVLVTRDYDGRADFNKSCRYVEVASCYGEDDDVVWNSFSDEYKISPKNHKVIAWMPLPEPWRGEEHGFQKTL